MTLSFVCFKWRPARGYRSTFGPAQVHALRNMIARHYRRPHRFFCVTDDPRGLEPSVTVVPLWPDHGALPSPRGPLQPSCYRRLKVFSAEAGALFGERFVCIDLDVVITGPLEPLFDRPEDFVIWGDTAPRTWYNGSLFMLRAGARRQVWEQFDPARSPAAALAAGQFGSDQAWISHCLGPNEARWGKDDGVFSYRVHLQPKGSHLPRGARVVVFHGKVDPWSPQAQRVPWIKAHYR